MTREIFFIVMILFATLFTQKCFADDMEEGKQKFDLACHEQFNSFEEYFQKISTSPSNRKFLDDQEYVAFVNNDTHAMFNFTKEGHYAYPTVVCRMALEDSGAVYMAMNVSCGAKKSACDAIVHEFHMINESVSAEIKKMSQKK